VQRSAEDNGAALQATPGIALEVAAGIFWALLTVVIWSAWPAYTRLSVVDRLTPQDLVALRYAVGGAILLPVLIKHARTMPQGGWSEGLVLAFFQGAPLALLVTIGVRYAPAGHMAALSPGLLPFFAAVISAIFLRERLSPTRSTGVALIAAGALAMAGLSLQNLSSGVWKGDLLFMCTGLMGSIYAVRMRRSGLSAIAGAALIGVYSMLVYLPLYGALWFESGGLRSAPALEVTSQALYQGVLMGAVSLFSLSRAIVILGASRAVAFISLVPVLGTIIGALVLGERPSFIEWLAVGAISLGVLLAAGPAYRRNPAHSLHPSGTRAAALDRPAEALPATAATAQDHHGCAQPSQPQ
jgi:drug/metabolite transporter (DMT)-like permease